MHGAYIESFMITLIVGPFKCVYRVIDKSLTKIVAFIFQHSHNPILHILPNGAEVFECIPCRRWPFEGSLSSSCIRTSIAAVGQ